jgi:hypothetical protein
MATSPPDDDFVRQMELLENVDPNEVGIPEGKPQNQPETPPVDIDKIAMERSAESGSSFLTPEQIPEAFARVSLQSGSGGMDELIELVRKLPGAIVSELRNM